MPAPPLTAPDHRYRRGRPIAGRPGRRPRPAAAVRLLRSALVIAAIWGALALAALLLWFARDLPRPDSALDAARRPSLTLAGQQRPALRHFRRRGGRIAAAARLPPFVPEAAVAVEDHRFWHQPGIDPVGMAARRLTDLLAGRVVQGGSTITQQVAKNLFLTNARTFSRKVQELMLTFWLEQHFTKREILEIWLNRVYLGAGAWGMDAAAHIYFGVSARHVTLWQAAVLAGLPRAPSRFNPRSDPAAAAARAREVLAAMVADGASPPRRPSRPRPKIAFPQHAADRAGLVRRLGGRPGRIAAAADTDATLAHHAGSAAAGGGRGAAGRAAGGPGGGGAT